MTGRLERYRGIVPDWDAFLRANREPEPPTLRVRRAFARRETVQRRLGARGIATTPVEALPDYLKVEQGRGSVAQTLEHWLGLFHVQQAVMGLPALALAPRPGERVLDLCAAPGGKTAHLSELMEERGPLVAVDPKEKRLRGLMSNVFRLGLTNVLVIAADGRELPTEATFDRVLVDAPCSAEGNYRRQKGRLPARTAKFEAYVTALQEALLRRAVALTRPGGTILYSTCTFAPEENEGVVDRVLREAPAPLAVERIPLSPPHAPGLTEWEGRRFHPDLERAWRVYPHHLDSGGLFMALLRRTDGETRASAGWSPLPPAFPGEDEAAARERVRGARRTLADELGFDFRAAGPLGWMVRRDKIWAQTLGEWPVEAWREHGGWRVVSAGLRAFRAAGGGKETPSNQFLGRFRDALLAGPGGEERRIELDREALRRLLAGGALDPGERPAGPLLLLHRGELLGRGMVGREGLRSEIPSARARRLAAILELETDG